MTIPTSKEINYAAQLVADVIYQKSGIGTVHTPFHNWGGVDNYEFLLSIGQYEYQQSIYRDEARKILEGIKLYFPDIDVDFT